MEIKKFVKQMLGLETHEYSDAPTYRCLRCGEEFERNYNSCPECSAAFVARADEE